MKFVTPLKTEKLSSDFIESNGFSLEYKNNDGEGYAKEGSIYNSLQYLAGYNIMQGVIEGRPLSDIEKNINKKYGNDIGNNIFKQIKNMDEAIQNRDSKSEIKYATELQNLFLKCIEQDIGNLKTKKEVEEYTNFYRAYKINNLVKAYDNGKECTYDYFDITTLDNKMANKIIQTKAFEMSNKDIANCLLFTTNEEYDQMKENYSGIYVPVNLNDVKYKNKNGQLVLNYNNITNNTTANKEITVLFKINGNGNVIITEIPLERGLQQLGETEATR